MERIHQESVRKRTLFYEVLEGISEKKKELTDAFGTSEWADQTYNILKTGSVNCPNRCKYCYIDAIHSRFKRETEDVEIEDLAEYVDKQKVRKGWRKIETPRMIMFPSSHDLFLEIAEETCDVVEKMIEAGYQVLLVTKPRYDCIQKLCDELQAYKKNLMFRFTIGSNKDEVLRKFEEQTPLFEERMKALQYAFSHEFQTSVSMEPFLSDPSEVIRQVSPYVTDSIWIGLMNHIPRLKKLSEEEKQSLQKLMSKKQVQELVKKYKDHDKVFWKESIVKLLLE